MSDFLIAGMANTAGAFTKKEIKALLSAAKEENVAAIDVTLPRAQFRIHFQAPKPQQSTTPAPTLDEEPEVVL